MDLPSLLHLAVITTCLSLCAGLECYVCHSQDSNRDKCIKTTKQCDIGEDICYTRIKWAVPPYWTPHADRIHYIWKDCMKWDDCRARRKELYDKTYCKRDWFNDWECVECCNGDLCNYYVTLGASSTKAGLLTMLVLSAGYFTTQILTRA